MHADEVSVKETMAMRSRDTPGKHNHDPKQITFSVGFFSSQSHSTFLPLPRQTGQICTISFYFSPTSTATKFSHQVEWEIGCSEHKAENISSPEKRHVFLFADKLENSPFQTCHTTQSLRFTRSTFHFIL